MTKVIFEATGGLGDNLQKSTLPRMLTEQGCAVYLNHTYEDRFIHNPEIRRMVWEMNPYVRGITEEEPTIIRVGQPNTEYDFIKNWERFYGLEPRNSYPEVYYRPNRITGIDVVFELSWLSADYTPETVRVMAEQIQSEHGHLNCKQVLSPYQGHNVELEIEKVRCETVFDLADILYSAKVVVTLSSGPHMLAAAIHKGAVSQYCIMPDWLPPFPHYRLPRIKYEYPVGHRS